MAVIKVEVANFCAAMDTLIDQDDLEGEGGEDCDTQICMALESFIKKNYKSSYKTVS